MHTYYILRRIVIVIATKNPLELQACTNYIGSVVIVQLPVICYHLYYKGLQLCYIMSS